MARYTDADCRLCRRYGAKLYLKGNKCFTPRCPFAKRNERPPGDKLPRRRKVSDRGLQLREKQKARFAYGVMEAQFRRYYDRAIRMSGRTGENLVRLLETRLDNTVYRLGLADSRDQARQLVRHGHVAVSGRKLNIPSAQVKVGDAIGWTERGVRSAFYKDRLAVIESKSVPHWLDLDRQTLTGRVVALPERGDGDTTFDENVIVEYYSR